MMSEKRKVGKQTTDKHAIIHIDHSPFIKIGGAELLFPMSVTHYEDEIIAAYLPVESLWLAAEPLLPHS